MAYDLKTETALRNQQSIRERLRQRAQQLPRRSVDVPEWDMIGPDALIVQAMTGTARDAYEAEITGSRTGKNRQLNLTNFRARLIARCLIDPNTGTLIYDYRKPQDIDELGALDAAGLNRVFQVCQELNGITDADVETLTKNSSAEANGDFGSS